MSGCMKIKLCVKLLKTKVTFVLSSLVLAVIYPDQRFCLLGLELGDPAPETKTKSASRWPQSFRNLLPNAPASSANQLVAAAQRVKHGVPLLQVCQDGDADKCEQDRHGAGVERARIVDAFEEDVGQHRHRDRQADRYRRYKR